MSKLEQVTLTNMCLIYNGDGRILVQKRNKSSWPGITFPGGHVEKNESFVESTIREVYEETGLTVSNLQLCGIAQWTPFLGGRYIVVLYKTNCYTGELKSSDEGEVFWIDKNQLFNYELSADLEEMFMVMDNTNLSEFYSLREDDEHEILRKLL